MIAECGGGASCICAHLQPSSSTSTSSPTCTNHRKCIDHHKNLLHHTIPPQQELLGTNPSLRRHDHLINASKGPRVLADSGWIGAYRITCLRRVQGAEPALDPRVRGAAAGRTWSPAAHMCMAARALCGQPRLRALLRAALDAVRAVRISSRACTCCVVTAKLTSPRLSLFRTLSLSFSPSFSLSSSLALALLHSLALALFRSRSRSRSRSCSRSLYHIQDIRPLR